MKDRLREYTESHSATPYNKGYREDIWSHGYGCTRSPIARHHTINDIEEISGHMRDTVPWGSTNSNFTVAAMFLIT